MFRRELGIWKRLRHSNILKFMGTTSGFGSSEALVAPWMTNGTLTSFLDQNNMTLRLCDRLLLLRDIAAGLNYLHTFSLTKDGRTDLIPVVHGDLTGVRSIYSILHILMIGCKTNVLIDGDRKAYLADFGLSGTFKKITGMTYLAKMSCRPGAVRWAAPELLSGDESAAATTRSDMYSFGSIMLQVLTGNVPWCHMTNETAVLLKVIGGNIQPYPDDVCGTAGRHWNFMTRCWSMTSTDRPPAEEAVRFVDRAISMDERHPSITRNDYLLGDTDARLPVMQDFDSPMDARETLSADYVSPTFSISSDERHPGMARNDYLRGDTDARLSVMDDIDLPLDAWENYPGVLLPAYSSSTTDTTSSEPSWSQSSALILPRPHTSDFSAMYHTYFPDEDDNIVVIPTGYLMPTPVNNTIYHNWHDLNSRQNASLQHYMEHVLRIQYLHADRSIDKLIWRLIHSSDSAREAACLLADLHRKSTQDAIGYSVPADHDVYTRIQRAPITEGDALASLCMVSYFLFSGGQGQWQAFLDSACEYSIKFLKRKHASPDWALRSCSDSMRFIIKTSMWFDVLASATLIRRPKFLEVLRSLYDPSTAPDYGRPELSMMDVMGCENHIVLALAEIADLACWKDECRRAGRLSVSELVRHGQRIEAILKTTNDTDYLDVQDTEKSRRRRLTSDVFRASALVYLHSVINGDHPQCTEIKNNIAETVECLRRAEDVSTARHVVRSVVFSICICGCLTDIPRYRKYFLRRLQEQQTETVGNCAQVAQLMREVWSSRERGEPVDWRVVMRQSQMLLV
ncbi:kinase-like domain-containing protein [Suillus lakei]|nr:kinase-like domain-containing protein [Suillus lakei]